MSNINEGSRGLQRQARLNRAAAKAARRGDFAKYNTLGKQASTTTTTATRAALRGGASNEVAKITKPSPGKVKAHTERSKAVLNFITTSTLAKAKAKKAKAKKPKKPLEKQLAIESVFAKLGNAVSRAADRVFPNLAARRKQEASNQRDMDRGTREDKRSIGHMKNLSRNRLKISH